MLGLRKDVHLKNVYHLVSGILLQKRSVNNVKNMVMNLPVL